MDCKDVKRKDQSTQHEGFELDFSVSLGKCSDGSDKEVNMTHLAYIFNPSISSYFLTRMTLGTEGIPLPG